MNVGHCLRAVARVAASVAYRPKVPSASFFKVTEVPSGLHLPITGAPKLSVPQISILPRVISLTNAPSPQRRIEIVDPLAGLWDKKKTPPYRWGHNEISLPNLIDTEFVEPPQAGVTEKKAARLIVIRRAKMKKHKWRKLQKKMKFEFARKRQRKELKKEKAFQAMLLARVKEAERFDAEEYVANQLKTAHWERPVTRVRGFFAPDWVIRDHLRSKEEEKRINARIDECLRMKK